jgi:hypothetical protein
MRLQLLEIAAAMQSCDANDRSSTTYRSTGTGIPA